MPGESKDGKNVVLEQITYWKKVPLKCINLFLKPDLLVRLEYLKRILKMTQFQLSYSAVR